MWLRFWIFSNFTIVDREKSKIITISATEAISSSLNLYLNWCTYLKTPTSNLSYIDFSVSLPKSMCFFQTKIITHHNTKISKQTDKHVLSKQTNYNQHMYKLHIIWQVINVSTNYVLISNSLSQWIKSHLLLSYDWKT